MQSVLQTLNEELCFDKPIKMHKTIIFKISSIIHYKTLSKNWWKLFFAKSRHNTSIITDFEWNIPKYKNKHHNL